MNANPLAALISMMMVAWQSYVPPPPPTLPTTLAKDKVEMGKNLFERSVLVSGPVEIYNYLGAVPCGSCHDQPNPLSGDSLAKKFSTLHETINNEIVKRGGGTPLPPEDPAMEALVQYLAQRYELAGRKMSK